MVFSSSIFLFVFMPLFFLGYFLMPVRAAKNVWLLLASLVFYAWGEPIYIGLMIVSILGNWILGLLVSNCAAGGGSKPKNAFLVAAVVFNLLVIGFFKYEGFLADSIDALIGADIVPNLNLPLPIGISFYTLQALSYVIDVYRDDVPAQRNPLYLGMYIACFPQLIAGPIVRYSTIQEQIIGRKETFERFASGMRLFAVGLAKKALLANTVAILATKMLSMGGPSVGMIGAWAGLIAYTFQIYFDFSGYSDMAIGLGRMMGFEYLRNFNYPYISRSITEFWRRWHISLSSFFRDYVYIPLGGSRCSKRRNAFNILVVWAITGLWHGAAWNFVGWGVYYGLLLICEKFVWGNALKRVPSAVGHVYTIAVFIFGWSFFWIGDADSLVRFWKAMAGGYGWTGASTFWELTAWEYWPLLLVCAVASTPIAPYLKERLMAWTEARQPNSIFDSGGAAHERSISALSLCVVQAAPCNEKRARVYAGVLLARDIFLLAIMIASFASIVSGSFNPFIYFQF